MEDVKIKLAVLWLLKDLTVLATFLVTLMDPGIREQIIAGEVGGMQMTPELLLVFAIILLVPLVMTFLSLTLKDSTNRWVNMILGIAFTGLELFGVTDVLAAPSAYITLMWVSMVVPPALIVWYAWKWPKQED